MNGIRASVDFRYVYIWRCTWDEAWDEPPTTVESFRVASIMQNGVLGVR